MSTERSEYFIPYSLWLSNSYFHLRLLDWQIIRLKENSKTFQGKKTIRISIVDYFRSSLNNLKYAFYDTITFAHIFMFVAGARILQQRNRK